MKHFIFSIFLLICLQARSQLAMNVMLPPGGVADKQGLWNILFVNPSQVQYDVQIQVLLIETATGQRVMTALSSFIPLGPGNKQITPAQVNPVQYISMSNAYRIDPSPAGLLPVGKFTICYTVLQGGSKELVKDCYPLTIQPLNPLMLSNPPNESELTETQPLFSWIPYTSPQLSCNIFYNFKLAPVYQGQSPSDAIQNNMPLFNFPATASTQLLYNDVQKTLQPGVKYAWQVSALAGITEVTKSEVWSFTTKENSLDSLFPGNDVYVKLQKENVPGEVVTFKRQILLDFQNETSDTTWNILVTDLNSVSGQPAFPIRPDSSLRYGQNYVRYDATKDDRFRNNQHYLIRLRNSRNEIWQVYFEYKKD